VGASHRDTLLTGASSDAETLRSRQKLAMIALLLRLDPILYIDCTASDSRRSRLRAR